MRQEIKHIKRDGVIYSRVRTYIKDINTGTEILSKEEEYDYTEVEKKLIKMKNRRNELTVYIKEIESLLK